MSAARKTTPARSKIARTIAQSPLVKTAIAGNDPNWGRIMAAAGRSGVAFDPDEASLTVCGHELFTDGQPTKFEKKTVAAALKIATSASCCWSATARGGQVLHLRFYARLYLRSMRITILKARFGVGEGLKDATAGTAGTYLGQRNWSWATR